MRNPSVPTDHASALPVTRTVADTESIAKIRAAVRSAETMLTAAAVCRLAAPDDADALYAFWQDPAVHAPIHTLPHPLCLETVEDFIKTHADERQRGEGLLFVNYDETGKLVGYQDIQVWPTYAAGKLAGALHPSLHGAGQGAQGARLVFGWMFDALHLDLICETADPANVRTARLLETLGFQARGEVSGLSTDGVTRTAKVWEMTRNRWQSSRLQ